MTDYTANQPSGISQRGRALTAMSELKAKIEAELTQKLIILYHVWRQLPVERSGLDVMYPPHILQLTQSLDG